MLKAPFAFTAKWRYRCGFEGPRARYTEKRLIDSTKWKQGEARADNSLEVEECDGEEEGDTEERRGRERAVKTELWLFARFARLRP